jgi:hypothetical protein
VIIVAGMFKLFLLYLLSFAAVCLCESIDSFVVPTFFFGDNDLPMVAPLGTIMWGSDNYHFDNFNNEFSAVT